MGRLLCTWGLGPSRSRGYQTILLHASQEVGIQLFFKYCSNDPSVSAARPSRSMDALSYHLPRARPSSTSNILGHSPPSSSSVPFISSTSKLPPLPIGAIENLAKTKAHPLTSDKIEESGSLGNNFSFETGVRKRNICTAWGCEISVLSATPTVHWTHLSGVARDSVLRSFEK